MRSLAQHPHFYRILAVFAVCFVLLFGYLGHRSFGSPLSHPIPSRTTCTPDEWSAGAWRRRQHPPPVTSPDDVYAASGFQGCASNREVQWHLASDHPDEYPWRGNVSAYEWVPGPGCRDVPDDREAIVKHLVEQGGWLLIGDSVSEEHFFSMSCTLYPHVIATPNYTGRWDWDRAWPQNLYLNPESPLVSQLRPPDGFEISVTPLVTFRRVDLLWNHTELETIHDGGQPPDPSKNSSLFGDEASWDMSPTDYLSIFFSDLPHANYHTLVVSTAGHWSLKLLAGLPGGYPDILNLFRLAMTTWVYDAARHLDAYAAKLGKKSTKEIIVRPYLTGDDACHTRAIMDGGPWTHPKSQVGASYNWEWIPRMNDEFQNAVAVRAHPNLHYLAIDRPGRLRPDSHALGDCLHWTVGTGVIEGWTQYIWYYTSSHLSWWGKPLS